MTWSKPFTPEEEQFVREAFGQLSSVDMAARLGRSKRGVNKLIERLGLRESPARASCPIGDAAQRPPEPQPEPEAGCGDHLRDLLELKGYLRVALINSGPQSISNVAREYRAVLDEIERIQHGGEDEAGGEADNPLGDIFALVPVQL